MRETRLSVYSIVVYLNGVAGCLREILSLEIRQRGSIASLFCEEKSGAFKHGKASVALDPIRAPALVDARGFYAREQAESCKYSKAMYLSICFKA